MGARDANVVLVVEDLEDDAKLLQVLLNQLGILNPVRMVLNGNEAVAYLKGIPPYSDRIQHPLPGIIFLDLKLPGMDGFEFLGWLKSQPQLKNTFIVVISGFGDLASIQRAYALGANTFLVKPCRAPDLENIIGYYPAYWIRSLAPSPPPSPI
jgi:CheY-like chemotaxis protein